MFSQIYIIIIYRLLLKYVLFSDLNQTHVNHNINNYYVVTFIWKKQAWRQGTDGVPEMQHCVNF
jgi:hypothetical protein